MSDSTESGSSRNPLDPDDAVNPGPDRDLERDPDPVAFREPGRDPDYDPAPDVAEGVDTPADGVDTSAPGAGAADSDAMDDESGSYVEGDYGDAGVVDEAPGELADEGEYTKGDYGDAGMSDGAVTGSPEGEYEEGDYGSAGTNERLRTAEEGAEGEYPEGDYGDAGRVGREPRDGFPEDEPS